MYFSGILDRGLSGLSVVRTHRVSITAPSPLPSDNSSFVLHGPPSKNVAISDGPVHFCGVPVSQFLSQPVPVTFQWGVERRFQVNVQTDILGPLAELDVLHNLTAVANSSCLLLPTGVLRPGQAVRLTLRPSLGPSVWVDVAGIHSPLRVSILGGSARSFSNAEQLESKLVLQAAVQDPDENVTSGLLSFSWECISVVRVSGLSSRFDNASKTACGLDLRDDAPQIELLNLPAGFRYQFFVEVTKLAGGWVRRANATTFIDVLRQQPASASWCSFWRFIVVLTLSFFRLPSVATQVRSSAGQRVVCRGCPVRLAGSLQLQTIPNGSISLLWSLPRGLAALPFSMPSVQVSPTKDEPVSLHLDVPPFALNFASFYTFRLSAALRDRDTKMLLAESWSEVTIETATEPMFGTCWIQPVPAMYQFGSCGDWVAEDDDLPLEYSWEDGGYPLSPALASPINSVLFLPDPVTVISARIRSQNGAVT